MAIDRVSLNNARRISTTISKQEFLEEMGVDKAIAAKLVAMGSTKADECAIWINCSKDILEAMGVSKDAINRLAGLGTQADGCSGFCVINQPISGKEFTATDIQKMVDKGVLKRTDLNATLLQKIRK